MKRLFKSALYSSAALAAFAASVPSVAQEITAQVRGTVFTSSGDTVANAAVTIVDSRTGAVKSATTGASGVFSFRGLNVGGPYTITVESAEYQNTIVTDVFANLSAAADFDIVLADTSDVEEITVVAQALAVTNVALGPSSTFDLQTIERLPSISRQVRDVIRVDPRVSIGRANGGNGFGISCLGGNNRSNSFTIDGVRSADGFGLNASGNLARNTFPIPFDSIAATSVEFSPVSVEYGQFTGCNVNVVTKSGSNEFHGSAFYVYNDGNLTGETLEGDIVREEPFKDKNWGAELSGPIIEDKLFFYVSYEETDGANNQNTGPIGASGFANGQFITETDANQVRDILSSQYGRDAGELVRTLPQTSLRYFGRIDWNINENHSFAATYSHLEEENLETDDFGFNGFSFSDNFEVEGSESDTYSFRLFSDWTDRLSTEIRVSRNDVVDLQNPLGGGEAQEENRPRIVVQDGNGNDIFVSGPGFFRSANALEYTVDQVKATADYALGSHTITAGYELDKVEVFNLFAANATGTIIFDDIAALQAGQANFIFGTGSFSGDINDAAANFSRDVHSLYIQDEWRASDALTVTAGLRYDFYDSGDAPRESAAFVSRYGFSNAAGFDGLDALMPRLGLTYTLPEDKFGETTVTAGFGIFAGGDPTVWFSNAFSNFGSGLGSGNIFGAGCTGDDFNVLSGGSFGGIPQCIIDQQQASASVGQGRTDAIDPDLKLATQNRFSFGIEHYTANTGIGFFDDWTLQLDLIYSKQNNSYDFVDLTLSPNGVILPDGRPQFTAIDPLLDGCNASFIGPRSGFSNVDLSVCDAGGDDQDILLTNSEEDGSTKSLSFQAHKRFLLGDATELDFRAGYAFTDAEIGNPNNSSTATSSFEEVAVAVINQPVLAPAQYANKHNIVVSATLDHDFVEDYTTSLTLFYRARSGRPFSYTYDNNTPTSLFGDSDNEERNLFYVPTGASDPNVDLSALEADGTLDDFLAFLETSGLDEYAGQISARNAFTQQWSHDLDLRFQQELPGFFGGDRFEVFVDFENFLNFLGSGNNVQRFVNNGDVSEGVPVLDAALSDDGTQYVYTNFNPGGSDFFGAGNTVFNVRDVDDSLWRIQVGIKYKF